MNDIAQVLASQYAPTLLVLLMAFLGLKRLGQYDQELRHIRDKVDEHAKTLREEIRADFQMMRNDISIVAERELGQVIAGQEDGQRDRIRQWREEVDAIVGKLERYDFLREYSQVDTAVELNKDRIGSLEKVHRIVAVLFNQAQRLDQGVVDISARARRDKLRREALDLVRAVVDQNIPGDHDDYHNMAAELARQDYPELALSILDEGMRRFPDSPDLIGSAMQYAVNNGELEKAEAYFKRMQQLDETRWNWRAFTFAVKFQAAKGDEVAARGLYDAARARLPDDERPAVQFAELFQRRGQTARAIEILEEVVARVATAPQSALRLAEFYKDQGSYRKAMEMGRRALLMDALDQSRINNAATHLTIGLAGEQLWATGLENAAEERVDAIVLREFLAHYAAALAAPDSPFFVTRAVETRKATVRGYLLAQGYSHARIDELFDETGIERRVDKKASPEHLMGLLKALKNADGDSDE